MCLIRLFNAYQLALVPEIHIYYWFENAFDLGFLF